MNDHKKDFDEGRLATTDGKPPVHFGTPAPNPEVDPVTKQHKAYWVLSESERAKGFVRPVRLCYVHVGTPGPTFPLRDLTSEEQERYKHAGYVKYEEYLERERDGSSTVGMFWTQERLEKVGKGCRVETRMGLALAETYAAKPDFYGSTMCVGCRTHLPVGKFGEFVWSGTNERVGT